ncbi:MAG TPA: hypothetical protein VF681_10760 [Abditibacteriaceae bacterium]
MKKPLTLLALLFAVAPMHADEATIRVQNVSPSLVAWWLDPQHQPEPEVIKQSRLSAERVGWPVAPTKQTNVSTLPAGLDKLTSDDKRNVIEATGTPESLKALREQIALFDKPLRQVEIEAQIVDVATEDIKAFGIDFPTEGNAKVGFVRNNFRATLNALQALDRTRTLAAPRVTTFNNLAASLVSQSATPVIAPAQAMFPESKYYIATRIGFAAIPTINNDDTVTIMLKPVLERGLLLSSVEKPDEVDDASWMPFARTSVISVANVEDGRTIALTGFMQPQTRALPPAPFTDGQLNPLPVAPILGAKLRSRELVVFVTARIIRRVDEAK